MRITRKVFVDLAIWMVGFGIAIGVLFPFLTVLLGVPARLTLTPTFFAACMSAGAIAGVVNFSLAHWVVALRLRLLSGRMRHVTENLLGPALMGDLSQCTPESCAIRVDSEDELGESAGAFNRLMEALWTALGTQAAVRSFSEVLSSHLELEALAQNALNQFFEHGGAEAGLILYESLGELKVAASRGLRDPEVVATGERVTLAARTGQRQVIVVPDDVHVDGVLTDFRPVEVIVHPVTYKGVVLGVVVLAAGRAFGEGQRLRVDLFLQGLGLALNNAMVHERLQRLAALDPLTSVYNRRFGMGRLHEEYGRSVRAGTPLGVLMLDIDHFKVVNDTYGHLGGDRVLKSISAIIRASLREGDVLLRYGGEEFLAVLPAAAAADLRGVGERVRKSVEDSVVEDGERTIRVTISIGGASSPAQKVDSEEALVEIADAALYRAKEAGRNRVEIPR